MDRFLQARILQALKDQIDLLPHWAAAIPPLAGDISSTVHGLKVLVAEIEGGVHPGAPDVRVEVPPIKLVTTKRSHKKKAAK